MELVLRGALVSPGKQRLGIRDREEGWHNRYDANRYDAMKGRARPPYGSAFGLSRQTDWVAKLGDIGGAAGVCGPFGNQ